MSFYTPASLTFQVHFTIPPGAPPKSPWTTTVPFPASLFPSTASPNSPPSTAPQIVLTPPPRPTPSPPSPEHQCTICLESLSPENPTQTLGCTHAFHEDCLSEWMLSSNTCPTCRWEIDPIVATSEAQSTTTAPSSPEHQCAICLEGSSSANSMHTLRCTHAFHEECLTEWMMSSNTNSTRCPMCRADIDPITRTQEPQGHTGMQERQVVPHTPGPGRSERYRTQTSEDRSRRVRFVVDPVVSTSAMQDREVASSTPGSGAREGYRPCAVFHPAFSLSRMQDSGSSSLTQWATQRSGDVWGDMEAAGWRWGEDGILRLGSLT
ncbi:hypothetical protein M011DRAFT_128875 [Sporormia fimetaria CBS 119925]|uniref:RING-type domain-containing protein n=1 Tax=Sporormia fimetaria CBS 119925 TaxID=1340428 RepID=A0A6A6V777_9PLEO|nr:hypothetical protein M011DRAFT_128875 [Sporormia fimetaria CBS 119925]